MEELKEYIESNLSPIQCEMVIDEVVAELEELTFDVIMAEMRSDNMSNEVSRILNDRITLKGINNDIRTGVIARVSLMVCELAKKSM